MLVCSMHDLNRGSEPRTNIMVVGQVLRRVCLFVQCSPLGEYACLLSAHLKQCTPLGENACLLSAHLLKKEKVKPL